jgi:hypothetical protein
MLKIKTSRKKMIQANIRSIDFIKKRLINQAKQD